MISAALNEKLVSYRRDFHRYAESGWTEFRTSSVIAKELAALGYDVRLGKEILRPESVMGRPNQAEIEKQIQRALAQGADPELVKKMDGYTGVVGILDTKKPGPVVAIRFDIDANDVTEASDQKHKPVSEGFRSVNDRVMHACGHDGHAAIGLGVAEELASLRAELKGVVKLIFQPAEEGVRGAKSIADGGILNDVDYIFAGHIGLGIPLGVICPSTVGFLCTTKFDAEFTGKSAHAGVEPNEGRNALLAAAAATVLMHAIPPHRDGATRINVGVLNAGLGRNVIAPNAVIKAETRGYTIAINDYVYDSAVKIINGVCDMYGVRCDIREMGRAVDCRCDEEMASLVRECASNIEAVKEIRQAGDMGGSEDVTFLIKAVQDRGGMGTFVLLGSEIAAGHHNEYFDFNEGVISIGVELFREMVRRLCGRP